MWDLETATLQLPELGQLVQEVEFDARLGLKYIMLHQELTAVLYIKREYMLMFTSTCSRMHV